MSRILDTRRKTIVFACCLVLLLSAVAIAVGVRTRSQNALNQREKQNLIEKIKTSPEQPLKIVGNDDSPLRIVQASVKELPGFEFTKLTGRTTDLLTVASVPEAHLSNTSGKRVTGFVIAVRDPNSRSIRGFVQQKVSIAPGENYTVERQHFVNPEKMTVADKDRKTRQTLVQPELDSEKYWIQFAKRSDLFITIGRVFFDDGSSWALKEGGEAR
jgi:hypothetical protein